MRTSSFVLAGIVLGAGIPATVYAQDPFQVASEACWRGVVNEARNKYGAQGVYQSSTPRMSQGSNAENIVSGAGTADNRSFSYTCTYNIRTGQAYSIHLHGLAVQQPSYPSGGGYNPGGSYPPSGGYYPPSQGYPGQGYRPGNEWNGSSVPRWAVGRFYGYNSNTRDNVSLDIRYDGRVTARINGVPISGRIKNGVLRAGLGRYYIERTRDGLMTRQVGNEGNVVYYRRGR